MTRPSGSTPILSVTRPRLWARVTPLLYRVCRLYDWEHHCDQGSQRQDREVRDQGGQVQLCNSHLFRVSIEAPALALPHHDPTWGVLRERGEVCQCCGLQGIQEHPVGSHQHRHKRHHQAIVNLRVQRHGGCTDPVIPATAPVAPELQEGETSFQYSLESQHRQDMPPSNESQGDPASREELPPTVGTAPSGERLQRESYPASLS